MATQAVEVKNFTGGRNSIKEPFNLFTSESVELRNIAIDTVAMRTCNYVPSKVLLGLR